MSKQVINLTVVIFFIIVIVIGVNLELPSKQNLVADSKCVDALLRGASDVNVEGPWGAFAGTPQA